MIKRTINEAEHIYKVIRWHSKHNIRKALRKILYGIEYYKDPYPPQSGIYEIDPRKINFIYTYQGIKTSKKKQSKTSLGLWLKKIKANYFSLELQPLRKLDRGMIFSSEDDFENHTMNLEDTIFFTSAKERFFKNISWKKTQYWTTYLQETGKTKEEVLKSLSAWEKVYFDIKKRGYLPQSEIISGVCPYCKYRSAEIGECKKCGKVINKENLIKNHAYTLNLAEIAVHVGKNGILYLSQGRHRLTFARLLNIKKVYVNIIVRHEEWLNFRKKILDSANNRNGKTKYPLHHIDLINIPHEFRDENFSAISSSFENIQGPFLELNSNWGYFSKKFGDLGFECFVHLHDPHNFSLCDKLKTAQLGRYTILKDMTNKFIVDKGPFYALIITDNLESIILNKKKYDELLDRIELANPKVLILNVENPTKSSAKSNAVDAQSVKMLLLERLHFPKHKFINHGKYTTLILKK